MVAKLDNIYISGTTLLNSIEISTTDFRIFDHGELGKNVSK